MSMKRGEEKIYVLSKDNKAPAFARAFALVIAQGFTHND